MSSSVKQSKLHQEVTSFDVTSWPELAPAKVTTSSRARGFLQPITDRFGTLEVSAHA
jgi:hypothetical protein